MARLASLIALLLAAPSALVASAPDPHPAVAPQCFANLLVNGDFEQGFISATPGRPQTVPALGGSQLVFDTSVSSGVVNAEYLNSSLPGVHWSSNATDFYNSAYFARFPVTSGCAHCNSQSRRGLAAPDTTAKAAWTFYSVVEIWNSAAPGFAAKSKDHWAELCSDQAATLYQVVDTTPGETLAWSFAYRARWGFEAASLSLGPPPPHQPPPGAQPRPQPPPTVVATVNATGSLDWTKADPWATYGGVYVVPPGQTRTMVLFTPLVCADNNPTLGNWVDDVKLCTLAPPPPSSQPPSPPLPPPPSPPSPPPPGPPPPSPAPPPPCGHPLLVNGDFEAGFLNPPTPKIHPQKVPGLGTGSELIFYTNITSGILNAEYLNTSRANISWLSNASDFYNLTYFSATFANDSSCPFCNSQSRRGLTAAEAAAARYKGKPATWAFYSIIELWNSAAPGFAAYSGKNWAELCSDQPATLFQDVATIPGEKLTWSFAHRARWGTEAASLQLGPTPGTPGGPQKVVATVTATWTPWVVDPWTPHSGFYTVPAWQTSTRLQFTPLQCADNNPTIGNWIDDVKLFRACTPASSSPPPWYLG